MFNRYSDYAPRRSTLALVAFAVAVVVFTAFALTRPGPGGHSNFATADPVVVPSPSVSATVPPRSESLGPPATQPAPAVTGAAEGILAGVGDGVVGTVTLRVTPRPTLTATPTPTPKSTLTPKPTLTPEPTLTPKPTPVVRTTAKPKPVRRHSAPPKVAPVPPPKTTPAPPPVVTVTPKPGPSPSISVSVPRLPSSPPVLGVGGGTTCVLFVCLPVSL